MGTPTLTVSMPTWRTPQLQRAVKSVLGQTHEHLRLVVVNDGGSVDLDHDPRLVVFDLDRNRGRYWADAVTLAACDTEWWTPHDADDVSEPDRYARQMTGQVSFTSCVFHWLDGTATTHPIRPGNPIAKYPAGVWRTEAARAIGINPTFRAGFDTVFVLLAWRLFDPAVFEGLYHVHKREGSLTTSPKTGRGTAWRARWKKAARDLLAVASRTDPTDWPRLMACPDPAFESDVQRLRSMLRG